MVRFEVPLPPLTSRLESEPLVSDPGLSVGDARQRSGLVSAQASSAVKASYSAVNARQQARLVSRQGSSAVNARQRSSFVSGESSSAVNLDHSD